MTFAPSANVQEGESEWDEVERELGSAGKQVADSKQSKGVQYHLRQYLSPVLVESFVLTFIAEWGDRSQVRGLVSSPPPPAPSLVQGLPRSRGEQFQSFSKW